MTFRNECDKLESARADTINKPAEERIKTMKRIVSALLVCTLLLACVFTLASCGKTLSGTYSSGVGDTSIIGGGTSYTFNGKNVKIAVTGGAFGFEKTVEYEGTYSIEDGKITFTFDSGDKDAASYNGSFDFEEGDG